MSYRLCQVLPLLAALFASPAAALSVEVAAPESLKALLLEHLEAARAARLGEPLDAAELARLRALSTRSAHELLATEGYFTARVESTLKPAGDDWQLRYTVEAGPRSRVRALHIEVLGGLAEAGEARLRQRTENAFTLQPGMAFRQADWDAAKLALLRPLLSARYPAARIVASQARIDPLARAADLSITLDSGPAFVYGEALISGSQRYPESIIRDLSPLKPGQAYRQQDLLDFQLALENSGYYQQATLRIDPDPLLATALPVTVAVVERPAKRLDLGAGVSTDSGARVQAAWLHRDVFDQALRLKLDARLETERQSAAAELAWPRGAKGYDYSLGMQLKREDIEGQKTRANLLSAKRSRSQGQIETTLALQYQHEAQELGSAPGERNQALTGNLAWTRRAIGRAIYPRRGHVLSVQAGGAAAALLSDTSFVRLHGRYTGYFPVGKRDRLILRGELGAVLADSRDGIPTDLLFRAGGDNSVRGYAYQSLGRDQDGAIASVRYLLTGSAEYHHFFEGNWGLAVFVDAGDAADQPGALSPVFGYGLGARYRSPLGPINLDLAYGDASDELRLHFALGVSF